MTATKHEERTALEKIRKIVANLGNDSYIAKAFEGCFEIAEENIENDWATSYKEIAETSEEKSEALQADIAELRKIISEKDRWIANLKQAASEADRKTLSAEDKDTVMAVLYMKRTETEGAIKEAAKSIVELAENPESEEFRRAVDLHRSNERCLGKYNELISRIERM